MEKYRGLCHCGAVQFEVETDLASPVRCNCSFCVKRGTMFHRIDAEHFSLIKGEDSLKTYGSRDFANHRSCKTCGIFTFTEVTRGDKKTFNINVGCLEGVDIFALDPVLFDGKNKL